MIFVFLGIPLLKEEGEEERGNYKRRKQKKENGKKVNYKRQEENISDFNAVLSHFLVLNCLVLLKAWLLLKYMNEVNTNTIIYLHHIYTYESFVPL